MYNLNPRYAMINDDVNVMKQLVSEMNYENLLDLCPRIKIPVGTLFYHSTKESSSSILNKINQNLKFYPKVSNCECPYIKPFPTESIGNKPRIIELSSNPTVKQSGCHCRTGIQERLYGNFNFAGNYHIELGKTILKGTEILINNKEVILIDLNYLSIEIGFSPKRFFINGEQSSNDFGKQNHWQSYCKKNNIDGLIMLDIVDVQEIDVSHKTILSCYNFIDPDKNIGVTCPEFALIATLGNHVDKYQPIGTEKLQILGMVDLVDDHNIKLERSQVETMFELFFIYLNKILNDVTKDNVIVDLIYYKNFTLFKQLSIKVKNKLLNVDELFDLLYQYIHKYGDEKLYVKYNKHVMDEFENIYHSDVKYLNEYKEKQLELFFPIEKSENIELYTDIIIHNIIPRQDLNYYFKDGNLVNYASDYLFDYLLGNIDLDINKTLYINYHYLSDIKNYEQYDMTLFTENADTKNNIKKFIDNLELHIITNFYLQCYVIYNKLDDKNINTINFLEALYTHIKINNNIKKLFRSKPWEQFKNSYLIQPEKYVCYYNKYNDIITKSVSRGNFMIKYLYDIVKPNVPLNFILESLSQLSISKQNQININFFNEYTDYLTKNTYDVFKNYINFVNNMYHMEI